VNAAAEAMKITYGELSVTLRERLPERLERAAQLRCAEHGQPVVAVTIHGRENGWFDSVWTTCCAALQTQAAAIVKARC
jgi:2-keto-3-deoxy-galactonokinase